MYKLQQDVHSLQTEVKKLQEENIALKNTLTEMEIYYAPLPTTPSAIYGRIIEKSVEMGEVKSIEDVLEFYFKNKLHKKNILSVIGTVKSNQISKFGKRSDNPDLVLSLHGLNSGDFLTMIGNIVYEFNQPDFTFLEPLNIAATRYTDISVSSKVENSSVSFRGLWIMNNIIREKCARVNRYSSLFAENEKLVIRYSDGMASVFDPEDMV